MHCTGVIPFDRLFTINLTVEFHFCDLYSAIMLERIHHDIFSQETETDDDKGRLSEMPSQVSNSGCRVQS